MNGLYIIGAVTFDRVERGDAKHIFTTIFYAIFGLQIRN